MRDHSEDRAETGLDGVTATARRRIEGEVGRRLVHVSGALVPLSYVLGLPYLWLQIVLLAGVVAVGVLELLRLRTTFSWWAYEHLTREYESDTVAGYALYVLGMAIVALAFDPRIAIPAMFMLAVADPVGGVLGGADPTPVKRPRAFVGAFLVSLAVGVPFVAPLAAAAGALAASLADGVFMEIRGFVVDDNLTIPLGAAGAIALMLAYGPV
ncbi:dolichol kinase [Salinarchaeum laminariae]|uniref:dolichol kinase n=1 Tax=Salinarchaeum laminariae TaxID=869888 RepID=UPI0020C09507|nr:dolichol kinase [Salinarchaeum laminariae]